MFLKQSDLLSSTVTDNTFSSLYFYVGIFLCQNVMLCCVLFNMNIKHTMFYYVLYNLTDNYDYYGEIK